MNELPIRILVVTGNMYHGGLETVVMNYYRNIDRTKVQFDFVEFVGSEPTEFDQEIKELGGQIYFCPPYSIKNHFTYVKWWDDFYDAHKGEYRVIHGHIRNVSGLYLGIAKKHGLYTIIHSHNTNPTILTLRELAARIYAYPARFIADHFFACSSPAAAARFGKKVANDASRCTILKNAIDVERFAFSERGGGYPL